MVRVVRLERTVSWSQTRRDTNFAIPGYSISAIIPRQGGKSKIFLSVVIYVVKADFIPLSATGESPANAGVAKLCGVSPHPIPDTATALPNQAPYQLGHTRILKNKRNYSLWSDMWSRKFYHIFRKHSRAAIGGTGRETGECATFREVEPI